VPGRAAIVFDLDRVLLDGRRAWAYTLEQAILAACGRRLAIAPLVPEYAGRPWRHALAVLLGDDAERQRCEALCDGISRRSALKQLLVHEGIGMALDGVRGARVEMGAISRESHPVALKQVEATGLERFLTVLSATPPGSAWAAGERFEECCRYLDLPPGRCLFVTADDDDLRAVAARGGVCRVAGWCGVVSADSPTLQHPRELRDAALALAMGN
jgi:beta-phosphoglucomutase-like phosphatase (HAD superfamily)